MKKLLLILILLLVMAGPFVAFAEDQIRDQSGVVTEIRQPFGNMAYAGDGKRNFIYSVMGIPGNRADVIEYRDKYGVHMEIGGLSTYQWAVSPVSQFDTSGQSSQR